MKKYIIVIIALTMAIGLISGGIYGLTYPFEKDSGYIEIIGGAYFSIVGGIALIIYILRNPEKWDSL